MDVESLAKQLILQGMSEEQQKAVLDSIRGTMAKSRELQKQKVGEQARLVIEALKKIEADIKSRYDEVGNKIESRVASIKDGKDGKDGTNGRDGRAGRDGSTGPMGPKGADGRNGVDGRDGEDGVSVTDAHIDFDGSLIISLSSGRTINVGEVVAPDLADKIKVITNGGGTSQTVLDTLASLQTQINNIYPSQTGNAGKFLTTNGTSVSWATVAGGLSFQGTWNASTNVPTLTSSVGINGYYYIVSTAGSTNLNGITDWQIGDWLLFNGSVWQKIDQSNLVTSVNGQTGAVSLTTTNISEGTNQYYLDSRARSAVSAGTGISYSSATGVITNSAPDQTVALTAGTGISTSGTYPNFTITNSAPDQTVSLTGAGTTSISGTYPSFTVTSNDQYTGTVTSVGGTGTVNGISLSGTVTSSGNLTLGGTLSNVSLTTQVTGTLPIANGGSGQTTAQTAMNAFAGAVTSGSYLRGNGTNVVMASIQAGDVPTLNQNTTGTASNVTGTVAIANGGTGQTTATAAFNALAPSQSSQSGKYLTTDGTNTSWATVNAGASLSNDTATSTNLYPLFAAATSGTPTTLYTSNAKLLYKPSTGELSVTVPRASNGIMVNSATVSSDYTIAAGDNGLSAGPVTINSGITVTVSSGSTWVVA